MTETTAYAALDDRLLVVRTTDSAEWTTSERLVGYDFECVAASAARPDRAFAGTVESGIQRSTDGGDSWERVASDVNDRVTALAVSPHDSDVAWAGTEPSAVYRSTDGGDTWTALPPLTDLPSESKWSFPPRPHTHHVRWLEPDPNDPERLYVAIEAGALVRTDEALSSIAGDADATDTWQDHPEGARRDNHTLATHPEVEGRVYTAAGDGYAQSEDGGDTWAYPQDRLGHRYVWGLAVPRSGPDTVVVSAATGPRSAHTVSTAEAYVYRTTTAGRGEATEWDLAMDGLPAAEGTVRSYGSLQAFTGLTARCRAVDPEMSCNDPYQCWPQQKGLSCSRSTTADSTASLTRPTTMVRGTASTSSGPKATSHRRPEGSHSSDTDRSTIRIRVL